MNCCLVAVFFSLVLGSSVSFHRDLAPVQIDLAAACTDSGKWAESVSTLLKNGAIVRSLGDTGTKMAPSLCCDFKLSNEGSFVEIGQKMTKLGWKVWKKSLQSLRAELQSLRAESIAVCMQRWSFRRRSLSWETSFDWSEKKVRALPGVSPHPAVRTWPGFQIKWTQPDFSWFFMRTIPAAENRGEEKLQKDIPETAWKNTEVFLWSINIFNNSSVNTFPGISQNLPENVSIFFAKMIDLCLLTQKNQTLQGVIGRNIALWQNLWIGVGRFERRSSSARASLVLCGRFIIIIIIYIYLKRITQ